MKPFFYIMLSISCLADVDAQSQEYFPMHVGDYWDYSYPYNPSLFNRYSIFDTMVFNDKTYYMYGKTEDSPRYYRWASQGLLYRYDPYDDFEYIWVDFNMAPGDTFKVYNYDSSYYYYAIITDDSTSVNTPAGMFENCVSVFFDHPSSIDEEISYYFAPNVGLVKREGVWMTELLWSAQIDGQILSISPSEITTRYMLLQSFPNPFNASTTIRYELPRYSHVRLSVYDILAREVAILGDREEGPGVNEVQWNASNVPSGIYFIQMQAGDYRQVRKVMVLK